MASSVNSLCQRVEAEIRTFCEGEGAYREDAHRAQEALRAEVRALEERLVQSEHDLQSKNSKIQMLEEEMANRSRQMTERITQLEQSSSDDGRAIVDLRDSERNLRSEVEHLANRLRTSEDQNRDLERVNHDLQRAEQHLKNDLDDLTQRLQASEGQLSEFQRGSSQFQQNEHQFRSEKEAMAARLAQLEAQTNQDRSENAALKDACARMEHENQDLNNIAQTMEDRAIQSEEKNRKLVREFDDELAKLRHEVDRHRRDIENPIPSYSRPSAAASPLSSRKSYSSASSTLSPRGSYMPPSSSSRYGSGRGGDVNVSVSGVPLTDLSVHLDSLQQRLRSP